MFKISPLICTVADTVKTKVRDFCFFPFLFIAWEYYNTGSFVKSLVTCCRDFMWPTSVIVAKSLNASPY